MFSKSAALYDRIYGSFKDYSSECRSIHSLIQNEHRNAQTLLDVACGTGEHARILRNQYEYDVDGIDLDDDLISIAISKNPFGTFHRCDMIDFDLGKNLMWLCVYSVLLDM